MIDGKPTPPQKNAQGGVDPTDRDDMQRAADADLITLPKSVAGTNCSNCKFMEKVTGTPTGVLCQHPQVKQPVNQRMCCAYWDNGGALRPWLKQGIKARTPEEKQDDALREAQNSNRARNAPKDDEDDDVEKQANLVSDDSIAEANDELSSKGLVDIERETALKWAARAIACWRMDEGMESYVTFRDEALEHAALVSGEFVSELLDEINRLKNGGPLWNVR